MVTTIGKVDILIKQSFQKRGVIMFNFSNKKKQRIISAVIAIVLVLAMVISLVVTTVGF